MSLTTTTIPTTTHARRNTKHPQESEFCRYKSSSPFVGFSWKNFINQEPYPPKLDTVGAIQPTFPPATSSQMRDQFLSAMADPIKRKGLPSQFPLVVRVVTNNAAELLPTPDTITPNQQPQALSENGVQAVREVISLLNRFLGDIYKFDIDAEGTTAPIVYIANCGDLAGNIVGNIRHGASSLMENGTARICLHSGHQINQETILHEFLHLFINHPHETPPLNSLMNTKTCEFASLTVMSYGYCTETLPLLRPMDEWFLSCGIRQIIANKSAHTFETDCSMDPWTYSYPKKGGCDKDFTMHLMGQSFILASVLPGLRNFIVKAFENNDYPITGEILGSLPEVIFPLLLLGGTSDQTTSIIVGVTMPAVRLVNAILDRNEKDLPKWGKWGNEGLKILSSVVFSVNTIRELSTLLLSSERGLMTLSIIFTVAIAAVSSVIGTFLGNLAFPEQPDEPAEEEPNANRQVSIGIDDVSVDRVAAVSDSDSEDNVQRGRNTEPMAEQPRVVGRDFVGDLRRMRARAFAPNNHLHPSARVEIDPEDILSDSEESFYHSQHRPNRVSVLSVTTPDGVRHGINDAGSDRLRQESYRAGQERGGSAAPGHYNYRPVYYTPTKPL